MLHHRLRAASGARKSGGGGDGIPTDYIAYYTMDNIVGNTLVDETGNYDGTIYGATAVPDGLGFDGVNDYVDVTLLPSMPQTFVYFVDITPDSVGENDTLVDMISGYGAVVLRFNSGRVRFYVYGPSSYTIMESDQVYADTRYRIVAQHSYDYGTELWINGSLIASDYSLRTITYRGNESGRRIGANNSLRSDRFFDGTFHKYIEYDRILTASEITEYFA